MDKLILKGIEIFGRHGCHIEEQQRGQIFKVDVEKIVGGVPRKLIETVAEEIAETLLEKYPRVESLKVVLHKPNAPLPVRYFEAAVEISRRRK